MARSTRNGTTYTFQPVGIDAYDSGAIWRGRVEPGAEVRVMQPYGCPRNGTMAHCYIESMDGEFIGLVLEASLTKRAAVTA